MPNSPHARQSPRTIVVTGATGMIGSALVARLRANGHAVRRLVRATSTKQAGDVVWDPERGVLPASGIEGADAVVHLAGAPIAQRWTASHKDEIRESRLRSTALLVRTIAAAATKPRVMLSGSALGTTATAATRRSTRPARPGATSSRVWCRIGRRPPLP